MFQNLSLKRKLLRLNLSICGAVMLVAMVALFVFQVLTFRTNFKRDTATLAAVVANNSTAALVFKDANGAAEVVNSLRAKPTVVAASLVGLDGSLFATFGKAVDLQALSQFPPAGESRFSGEHLLYTQEVLLDGKQIGKLHLRADYQQTFQALLGAYAMAMIGVVIVSFLLAVFLSDKLGGIITLPVLQLAHTAQIVGEKKDYSVRAPVGSQGDELGRLTAAFNQMLSRIEAQDQALKESQERFEIAVAGARDGIWDWNLVTNEVYFSRQWKAMLGYQENELESTYERWLGLFVHTTDRDTTTRTLTEYLQGKRAAYEVEFRLRHKDGSHRWILARGAALRDAQGKPYRMAGSHTDITRRKLATEQITQMQQKLIETSRLAGMAEVATGVLHNVGNVLNSVSVSATLVGERLRQSKVTNLCRATTMLREQNGNLVDFLTSHPKGKLLPEYLGTVADQLAREQAELIAEMASVAQHIEHIKEIVAMQQSYAKVSGAYENLSVAGLVEDALRMNTAAFERHRIQVVREFDDDTPTVCADRHKVLQILINLVRNAKYAMDEQKAHDKRLVIQVGLASPDRVKITVSDNGVGIAPENLIKIFGLGFTTKRDGHGFGLHSGANAAKEMGGSLTAHSAGVGQGAEFVLELPTHPNARKEEVQATQGNICRTQT